MPVGALLTQCGLDKAHSGADMATQEAAFRDQLALGQELRRPISVGASSLSLLRGQDAKPVLD